LIRSEGEKNSFTWRSYLLVNYLSHLQLTSECAADINTFHLVIPSSSFVIVFPSLFVQLCYR